MSDVSSLSKQANVNQKVIGQFSEDLNGDGNYEPELNCQWTLAAPPGKVVKLRFTQFQLEMRQNDTHQECWDYLEIRNGDGPFAQKVDGFLGTVI